MNAFSFLQSKTYDSTTEKYLDFSFEKTNSAYMLFYEREETESNEEVVKPSTSKAVSESLAEKQMELNPDGSEGKPEDGESMVVHLGETEKEEDSGERPDKCDIGDKEQESTQNDSKAETLDDNEEEEPMTASQDTVVDDDSVNQIEVEIERSSSSGICKELEDWIWQDNKNFLQDVNIFEHTYFK